MQHTEFEKGKNFMCGGKKWMCTDKGSRVITAIQVRKDPSWMIGPPYAGHEMVFDEYDMPGCSSCTTESGSPATEDTT